MKRLFICSLLFCLACTSCSAHAEPKFAAQTSAHSVAFSWTASVSTITGYNVYKAQCTTAQSTTGGSTVGTCTNAGVTVFTSLAAGAVTWTDTAVVQGQSYEYYLTAFNSNGESAPSTMLVVTIPPAGATNLHGSGQ